MLSAPRAYYMFKTFGAQNVHILNGAFQKWKNEGRPTESGESETAWTRKREIQASASDYNYNYNSKKVVTFEEL